MAGIRSIISTLAPNGEEYMGPTTLLLHYPQNDIVTGSLLTVESNHFCVLKSRGAILNVYETGQYTIETPQSVLFGSIQQAFYGGQSPWQYEALYVNRAKLVVATSGLALSSEMAEMAYNVDYYIHVDTKEDAVKLVQHMPYSGHVLSTDAINAYAGPVVEQSINQLLQVTPMERINERIHELTELVYNHLQEFLAVYGIHLNTVKVLVKPHDERMKALISLKAFGLSEIDAVRYYAAMLMAQHGAISAPNMACGQPFNIGGITPNLPINGLVNPFAGGGNAEAVPTAPAGPILE